MSKKLIIKGGIPLKGSVRLGGAKNASFKLMIASLLIAGETRLLNFSDIADVHNTKEIIHYLGGKVISCGERTLLIDTSKVVKYRLPKKCGSCSRASTIFLAPLLARFGKAEVPLPGGDKIGPRPLDRHIKGLSALGVKLKVENGCIKASCFQLVGCTYKFSKNTHTGTETMIMAAVLAKGKTLLQNAALEPEVDDLIGFLNKMGAKIKRLPKREIQIIGVNKLKPVIYKIVPDRNEAISYAIAAIVTKGDVVVENAKKEHLTAFLDKLHQAGAGIEYGNYGIRFFWKTTLKAVNVTTKPEPGFMTDWHPLWAVLASQAKGESKITESVYLERFNYVKYLKKMGAKITYFHPKVKNPDSFYNFNLIDGWDKIYHGIKIKGPVKLHSINADIPDLRAGATLVLAGLIANNKKTVLSSVEQIDRGYENLDGRLRKLGADIKRI